MKNLRAFKIKALQATNTKNTRVSIKDMRNKTSKIISWDYEFNSMAEIAISYLKSIGIKITCKAECGEVEDVVLTDNFETELK